MTYLAAGDVITCINGHPYLRFTRTPYVGEEIRADLFEGVGRPDPKPLEELHKHCQTCGEQIIDPPHGAWCKSFRTAHGWKTARARP